MCIAILVKPEGDLTVDQMDKCWSSNSHGAGFAYLHKGKVHISKGFMELSALKQAWTAARKKFRKSPFLLHFRIQSQGSMGPESTHPFAIANGAMIHNGTLTGTGSVYGNGPTDSELLAKHFSEDFTEEFLAANIKELGDAIGYSKLVFLLNGGKYFIANERLGTWANGNTVWFSNSSFNYITK